MTDSTHPYWAREELQGAPLTRACMMEAKTIGETCGNLERLCVRFERERSELLKRVEAAEAKIAEGRNDLIYHMTALNRLAKSVGALGEKSEDVVDKAIYELAHTQAVNIELSRAVICICPADEHRHKCPMYKAPGARI